MVPVMGLSPVKMGSLIRNLKIKIGTCKRITKELHSYEREVEREAAKTADMKEKGADPYDLKQQAWSNGGMSKNDSAKGYHPSWDIFVSVQMPIHPVSHGFLVYLYENVLAESRMMIPDCRKRLEASLADIKETLAELELNQQDGEEIEEARSVISEMEALCQTSES
ncbi:hypothetical protein IFM89_015424 [Coptis chinensis]|uniref:Tubulin-specific chaperone A n=1 Tax=Coptis chinensis TaxID=261450 RepID=A0A835IW24_9MAGN|nr:hypothetical protein IFM89_015424 [Coptis chinensis]